MFRNQYDNDVTVLSPDGRIRQVEYAMEAVKQGSATVGLRSDTHAVLVALKRTANDLTDYQKKVKKLDEHMGISMAGLLSDGRILSRSMETECIEYRWAYNSPIPVREMTEVIEDKSQGRTQGYGRRPFGVGLLIAAYDDKGPHIVQTCPSAHVYYCKCMAIGARAQSARTYLERNVAEFAAASLDALIIHGLRALRDTLPAELSLDHRNTTVAVVGKDTPFRVYDDADVRHHIDNLNAAAPPAPPPAAAPMEQDPAPAPQA